MRGRMPTMELINERFARYLRIGLFNYMHRNVEVSVGPIKVQKFSEFVRNLVVPTNLNLFTAKPCAVPGWWCWTRTWSSWWWTTSSAATGVFTRVEGRDFTPPSSASSRAAESHLHEYAKSGRRCKKLDFEYVARR